MVGTLKGYLLSPCEDVCMCVCVFVPRERKSEGTFFIVIRRIMDGNGIGLERTVIIFRMVALMV